MTPKHALKLLRKLRSDPDRRRAQEVAEDIVMDLLNDLDCHEVGEAWARLSIREGAASEPDQMPPLHLRKVRLFLVMPGTEGMVVNGYVTETADLGDRQGTLGMEIEVVGLIKERPAGSHTPPLVED